MRGLYEFFTAVAGNHGRGYFPPNEIGRFYTAAQTALKDECIESLPERESAEALRPFRAATTPTTAAFIPIPADYHQRIGLFYNPGPNIEKPVIVSDDDKIHAVQGNSLRGGSGYQYALLDATGYRLYPSTPLPGLVLRYYSKPKDIVFGWAEYDGELIINDQAVSFPPSPTTPYTLPASVLPQFDTPYWLTLTGKALQYAGISIDDAALTQQAAKYVQDADD